MFAYAGYVFEAEDRKSQKRVALKRIEKVGNQLSREYEILESIKDCENVVRMEVDLSVIQDFFYSKNDQGKLIQNIVF
jgi:glycogen synthase kinase 3 beta